MLKQDYWNRVGSKKVFEDPLYIEELAPFISAESRILEYGCGYGRMLEMLHKKGYHNLVGYDFSKEMIARGRKEAPHLDLHAIETSGQVPEESGAFDCVVMSTILCCITDRQEQEAILAEMFRLLRPGGVFYLTDFLLCEQAKEKYEEGLTQHQEWGVYTTSEGLTVKHYSSGEIFSLMQAFDIQWFKQFDFKTMNHNHARTFHAVATKRAAVV